jgi:hypothetical protein
LNVTVKNLRIESNRSLPSGSASNWVNLLICDIQISCLDRTQSFLGIRVDQFVNQLVESFVSLSFGSATSYLYIDGYDCYLRFDGKDSVAATFSCEGFPANRTEFSFAHFTSYLSAILESISRGILSLQLSARDILEIRQSFKFGWLIAPKTDALPPSP